MSSLSAYEILSGILEKEAPEHPSSSRGLAALQSDSRARPPTDLESKTEARSILSNWLQCEEEAAEISRRAGAGTAWPEGKVQLAGAKARPLGSHSFSASAEYQGVIPGGGGEGGSIVDGGVERTSTASSAFGGGAGRRLGAGGGDARGLSKSPLRAAAVRGRAAPASRLDGRQLYGDGLRRLRGWTVQQVGVRVNFRHVVCGEK